MEDDERSNGRSRVASEILAYLVEHPDAQDTVEGIMRWWLTERIIKEIIKLKKPLIEEAVAELVEKKLVLEFKGEDSEFHYRINRNKSKDIQEILKQKSDNIKAV